MRSIVANATVLNRKSTSAPNLTRNQEFSVFTPSGGRATGSSFVPQLNKRLLWLGLGWGGFVPSPETGHPVPPFTLAQFWAKSTYCPGLRFTGAT